MEEEKKKINTGGTGCYLQVISEYVKVSATQTELKKVADMVGTFLSEDSNGLWITRVLPTKTGPKKVASTVATFLNKGSDGFKKS